jgi:hypothetical protein
MNDQHGFAFPDHFDNDAYSGTRMRDRALNAAIIRADISNSYEEYLEIFDEFYADDVEASDERRRADSWEGAGAIASHELSGPASRHGRGWWSVRIHSRNACIWRRCR